MSASQPSLPKSPASDVAEVTRAQFLQLFAAVLLPMFLAAADQTLLATATPVIAAEFGQLHDTSWLATAYLLTNAVMITVYGRLGDRFGRREVLFVALGIFVVGAVICAAAQSMNMLIAGRAIQGLGGGGLMTMAQAMIAELVPPRQRVRFQGYFAIVFTSANIMGPMIGGYTVAHASWRWLFAAQLPLVAFAAWRLSRLPRGHANPEARGIADIGGLVMFIVAATLLLFGLSSAGHRFAWLSVWSLVLFGGGALLWTALILHERRVPAPFFPMELLGMRVIRLSVLTVISNAICRIALIFYLPIYLQVGMHLDAGKSGLMLMPIMLFLLISQQMSTRLGMRTGRLNLMPAIGMAITALGFIGLGVFPPHEALAIAFGCVVGFGLGPAMPCSQLIVQTVAGRERLGAVTALSMLSRTSGSALGAAVAGAIIYGLLPNIDIRDLVNSTQSYAGGDVLRAFHVQFLALALVAALGAINGWRVPRIRIE